MSDSATPSKAPFRPSPFRRPNSPLGRSPSTLRAPTPQGSPLKHSTPSEALDFNHNTSRSSIEDGSWIKQSPAENQASARSRSPIPFNLPTFDAVTAEQPVSRPAPLRRQSSSGRAGDPLSSVPGPYLHTMRESFSVLDRSNSGHIKPTDVSNTLSELGLDSSAGAMSTYFTSGSSSLNLGAYLNLLARDLVQLSRQDELTAAFSAFDNDDSGQIDVSELRDALLNTAPESGARLTERDVEEVMQGFVGRRVLKKGQMNSGLGGKKEVFRYGDFTSSIWGTGTGNQHDAST